MKIFVGNIASEVTAQELRSLFEYYGGVQECDIIRHYGFVHMEKAEEAAQAMAALHQYELRGQKLNVAESRARPAAVTKVYVGNLAAGCSEQELRALFEQHGRVVECDIVKGAGDGRKQADYGFVHMEREEDAVAAIAALDDKEFNGNRIRVQLSRSTYGKSAAQRDVCQRCGRQGHQARDCHSARHNQYSQYQTPSQYYPPHYSYCEYDYGHGSYHDYYDDYQSAGPVPNYAPLDYGRERSPNRLSTPAAAGNNCTLYERTRLSPLALPKYQNEKFIDDSISRYDQFDYDNSTETRYAQ